MRMGTYHMYAGTGGDREMGMASQNQSSWVQMGINVPPNAAPNNNNNNHLTASFPGQPG